jgi:hypothetical protein
MTEDIATAEASALTNRPPPLSGAERMRRSRERRKKGLFCCTLELRLSEVDALVRGGRLKPEERASLPTIKNAVYSVLENWVISTSPFPASNRRGIGPHGGAA